MFSKIFQTLRKRERALRILKEAYKQLGYDEYAEKISGFETN